MTITAETSSIPVFVAELVRTANEVDRLTVGEIDSLLLRAIPTVREQAGIPGSSTEYDAIVRLELVATSPATQTQEKITAAVIEAADMVRTLWIVVDSRTVVSLKPDDEVSPIVVDSGRRREQRVNKQGGLLMSSAEKFIVVPYKKNRGNLVPGEMRQASMLLRGENRSVHVG